MVKAASQFRATEGHLEDVCVPQRHMAAKQTVREDGEEGVRVGIKTDCHYAKAKKKKKKNRRVKSEAKGSHAHVSVKSTYQNK